MKRVLLVVFVALSVQAFGQINVPAPSPLSTIEQKVGLTDLSITYSRPGVKGRKIFGDLVPYGELWRWGANASTKFKTSSDITIGGHDVPKGEYALYAIPGKDKWTIVIHTNTSHWGTGRSKYKQEEDLVRFEVVPNNAYHSTVETMTFGFSNITSNSCNIEFTWENTQVLIDVKANVDEQVMKEIEMKMKGVTSATYFQAARYYYDNEKDINKAYEWIKLALVDNEKFWMVRLQALIEAKMGNYKDAIKTATHSKELAETAGNKDYVRMNEKSIEEWKAM
ncbi:MAG: DUF2911 domain-containing protein [Bacteroidia bacterium]|nr:DUF2911 domain-containing protein [Bacteroidia bacterium]